MFFCQIQSKGGFEIRAHNNKTQEITLCYTENEMALVPCNNFT